MQSHCPYCHFGRIYPDALGSGRSYFCPDCKGTGIIADDDTEGEYEQDRYDNYELED